MTPEGASRIERSSRKTGASGGFRSLGQQRTLVVQPVGICKSKSQKRAYARPSKRVRHLLLRHQSVPNNNQSTPSSKRDRPTEDETALPSAETTATDERQAQLRAIASDLLYWKGGLKVLRQAQLPKWRGSFKWQIEAKIEALQTEYAKLRAECAKEG